MQCGSTDAGTPGSGDWALAEGAETNRANANIGAMARMPG
jgi:hypothetical protein